MTYGAILIFLQSVPSCFWDYPKLSNFQQVKVPAESLEQLPVSSLQVGHLQRVLRLGVFLFDVQWHCVHALQDAFAQVAFGWHSPLPCIVWPTSIHHFQMKHQVLNSNIAQHESEIWSQDWRPANNSALQRHGRLFQLLLPNLGRGRASLASPASVMSLTSWKHQVMHWFHLQAIDFHVISKFHVKFTWTATCFLDLISEMEDESLKTSTSSVQKLLWWPNLIFMIWGRNFFFAALFLPQIHVSCYCDSVDPICCQGAAFVSELCHLNRDSYRPDLAAFGVHPSTANVPKFLFMWSYGINPWYQHDTQHWHVVCFIPALASLYFRPSGKGNKKRIPWDCSGAAILATLAAWLCCRRLAWI